MTKKQLPEKVERQYSVLVAECKRLRAAHERAEAEFFLFLVKTEVDLATVWQAAGCASFEQFLRSHDLCEASRYIFFRQGLKKSNTTLVLQNGAHWTIALGKLDEPTRGEVSMMLEKAEAFVDVHHTAPSEQVVRDWVHKLRSVPDINVKRRTEIAALREENRVLKAELRAARARIAELEKRTA